ncbi:DJ-1 family glyoxalase III [Thiospirillum jenense]|uniref:DJ-1/PfpI family protein n=1 Tax=Thiospirillum jenense TaxID=1653858 RepID=A0A839HDJ2_9GAMM|nr:DJ-1 family glyoxalase III [Thiospirillum jenense]MBB1126963.1 DJ-1/PfpI family protein [Thiospirillum jenense]
MPRVMIPLANGCEELEAVTLIDLLRRAEIEVVTVGLENGEVAMPITASRGTRLIPDQPLAAVINDDFDMIILPGGLPGAEYLDQDPRIHQLLQRHAAAGHYTAAICAAPRVLAHAGLLNGRHATVYPSAMTAANYPDIHLQSDAVVVDGKVITSRGPGTAMDFALMLIELLVGATQRQRVEAGLVRD